VASRAESPSAAVPSLPREPRLGGAIRAALSDFYFNSLRFVAANLIWTVVLVFLWVGFLATPPAVLLTPLLAFPTASIFRIAGLVHRGELASFWDGLAVWRTDAGSILLLGLAIAGCMAVFLVNLWFGITMATPIGWSLATLAAWGLVVTWMFAWTAWPVLMDPRRADRSIRDRLRVAGLLVIAFPIRFGVLSVFLAAILVVSTVAVVVLATVAVAFAALVATRYVLPAADRLEHRLGPRSV
jgi:hypothetical protein